MDKAADVLSETVNRTPTAIQSAIANVRGVYDERFASIAQQFAERDVRADRADRGGKEAIDAALLAAKELFNQQNEANRAEALKTEQNFTKQIDAQAARIDELKERIDRGEGQSSGSAATVLDRRADAKYEQSVQSDRATQLRATLGIVIAAFSAVVATAAIIVLVVKG
jgi:hypothetical protein